MPFAAKNMYYDERWIEKQEEGNTYYVIPRDLPYHVNPLNPTIRPCDVFKTFMEIQ